MSPFLSDSPPRVLACLSFLALLTGACEARTDRTVRRYVELAPRAGTPVDAPAPTAAVAPAPAAPPGSPASANLKWTAPASWTAESASGMRLASFAVSADGGAGSCSIVILAGDGGGMEANVRRWMGQIGLPPPSDEALKTFLETQEAFSTQGGLAGRWIDLTTLSTPESPSMLAALVEVGGRTAFLKLTGATSWLHGRRGEFRAFCQSLEVGS